MEFNQLNNKEKVKKSTLMKFEQIRILKNKIINRETVAYVISGILTTGVNLVSYFLLCYIFLINNLIANVIAWFFAVTFAYFMNATIVFQEKESTVRKGLTKLIKFFFARGFSLVVEEAGLFIFVSVLGWSNMLVKSALAVIVILMNYILSKVFIFNGK